MMQNSDMYSIKKCGLKNYMNLIKRTMKFAPNRNTPRTSAFDENQSSSDNSSTGSSYETQCLSRQRESSSYASSSSSSSSRGKKRKKPIN